MKINTKSFPSLKSNLSKGGRTRSKVKSAVKVSRLVSKRGPTGAPDKKVKNPFGSLGANEGFGKTKNASALAKSRFLPMKKQGKRDTGVTLLGKAMGRLAKYGK